MSRWSTGRRGRKSWGRRAPLPACALAALTLVLVGPLSGRAGSRASAQPSFEEPRPQTDASVPASEVTLIGATPEEPGAPGANEVWGLGSESKQRALVRYTSGNGWTVGPGLQDQAGQPLTAFTPVGGAFAAQLSAHGAGVMVGETGAKQPAVLVRAPDGAFVQAESLRTLKSGETAAEGEVALAEHEALFTNTRVPLIAPLDEEEGHAGALVVPVIEGSGSELRVLRWEGGARRWSAEPIEAPPESEAVRVLGIGATGPHNAWLLAQLAGGATPLIALFRRVLKGEKWSWKLVTLGAAKETAVRVPLGGGASTPLDVVGASEGSSAPSLAAEPLSVSSEGVWVDGRRTDIPPHGTEGAATVFVRPKGEGAEATEAEVQASWCVTPGCSHQLPEGLPSGAYRSFAWGTGAPFGQRVISGLPEGLMLTLNGETFQRVLSLGEGSNGGEEVTGENDPGAKFGAAFVRPGEGWVGLRSMPVHMTIAPEASRLAPWPVPFRHALLAVAPQPGAPLASLSSEALAVGDQGAVARFRPGEGWQPETLFGPGGRTETPRLRAVAWPTPNRAFAVGDEGQMWLWRGETGLWERDPATPLNFRGNLLGIAFDPSNPATGYAVGSPGIGGEEGVLLRYGKTWRQETELPKQVKGAYFFAVAFAGSEAIVAYRTRRGLFENTQSGGLIVNDGSGWHVDEEAARLLGGGVPGAIATLPDGGAAFTEIEGPEGNRVYERQGGGQPWQATPVPLPGSAGSLALFREGGALRAIVTSAGGVANVAEPQKPPPGFPSTYEAPLGPIGGPTAGGVVRQTASGWHDDGHELDPINEPPGNLAFHDLPYRPDPISAILVDPSGAQGWAVGGELSEREPRVETADVSRYPADGSTPLGEAEAKVALPRPQVATTFAVGGGAACAGPCADRALAGVGPNVWLENAMSKAAKIGVHSFLYTGPGVTAAKTNGPLSTSLPLNFGLESGRYAQLLAGGVADGLGVFAAPSPNELDARESAGNENAFESGFAGMPVLPFGTPVLPQGLSEVAEAPSPRSGCTSAPGCEAGYYAFTSEGVRVIVLDDSGDVNDQQLEWLESELANAKANALPAIVMGNADLDVEIREGDRRAVEVARTLVTGTRLGSCPVECASASAYLYDAPEVNEQARLQVGADSIPSFGSGTLGYVSATGEGLGDFHGASGFLLVGVNHVGGAPGEVKKNRVPVTATLIPAIGELALEAKDGILLRRSAVASFAGLARRPRAGNRAESESQEPTVDPYIPIPSNCVGAACPPEGSALLPEYTFTSERPEIGDFVAPNLAANSSHAVLLNSNGEPIRDSKSGLFCAFNPGQTKVTISAGGLAASLVVTVQPGSVREPCGTVKLNNQPAEQVPVPAPPPPAPAPAPAGPAPTGSPAPLLLPVPVPPPASAPAATPAPKPAALPFLPLAAATAPVLAFVPPPVPTPARPTPPSGTSAVTSPVEVAEHEEEEEEATESVSNQAVAYRAPDQEPITGYILGVIVLAAFAGASIGRRARRGRRQVPIVMASVNTLESQRRGRRR